MSVVYFIRSADGGAIKVGTTTTLKERFKTLDCGPEPLCLIGTIDGGRQLEKLIHTALRPHRRRFEWFRSKPEVLTFVDRALAEPSAIPAIARDHIAANQARRERVNATAKAATSALAWAVDRICRREGVAAVTAAIGVGDDQVRKYRRGTSVMNVVALARLKTRWPDDFALVDLILNADHISAAEIRQNRASIEEAADALRGLLGRLKADAA